jgi:hypothetical protein
LICGHVILQAYVTVFKASRDTQREINKEGCVNVLFDHQPTIGDKLFNKLMLFKSCSTFPKRDVYQPQINIMNKLDNEYLHGCNGITLVDSFPNGTFTYIYPFHPIPALFFFSHFSCFFNVYNG